MNVGFCPYYTGTRQHDGGRRCHDYTAHASVKAAKQGDLATTTVFPISTQQPLSSEALSDVQIQLHAFLINLYGLFETSGGRLSCVTDYLMRLAAGWESGCSTRARRSSFPKLCANTSWKLQCSNGMASTSKATGMLLLTEFRRTYHRRRSRRNKVDVFNELSNDEVEAIKTQDWERVEEARVEKQNLGQPAREFLHAFTEAEPPRPILLNGQVVTDAMTVAEAGKTFLTHWQSVAQPSI
jgi:predicted dehydrogenase